MKVFTLLSISSLLGITVFNSNAQEQPRRPPPPGSNPNQAFTNEELDERLQTIITDRSLTAISQSSTALPSITSDVAQL